MIGFHIDMNMAQYRGDYLRQWLRTLARKGYDTILWEVENNIQWDTCPECVSPDAFTKDEFCSILRDCRELGLEPIPLLQTIGHAEYVLKHSAYAHLKELPGRIDQYCPRNPAVIPFLSRWIDEYLQVFGPVRYFHLGADEAWILGSCPECKGFANQHSLSQLYIDHINPLAQKLVQRGITPCLWADMVLHHPEALDRLSRGVMLFDWMYDIYRGNGKVMVWGQGRQGKEEFSVDTKKRFGNYLFPRGDEPGREPETFYTADFLVGQGFKVVTCPASSSYGDTVFTPRNWLHLVNTYDSFQKGMHHHLDGSLLTSWSVRLHPWELQQQIIDMPGFINANPRATLSEYLDWWGWRQFGCDSSLFEKACGFLSPACLFSDSRSLGVEKDCLPVADRHILSALENIQKSNRREDELAACKKILIGYRTAKELLEEFKSKIKKGDRLVDMWLLAAANLINRAQISILFLENLKQLIQGKKLQDSDQYSGLELLHEMKTLREETDKVYRAMIKPVRCAEMIEYMYGSVEKGLGEVMSL